MFLFFSGAVNASNTAAVTVADSRLKKLADEGNKKAVRLLRLTSEPSRYISGVETGRVIFSLLYFLCAYAFCGSFAAGLFKATGEVWSKLLGALAVLLVTAVLYLFLAVQFPKRIGAHFCEKMALSSVNGLCFVCFIFTPLAWVCEKLGSALARLFGVIPGESDEQVTEEEIRLMVDVGKEKGVIEDIEKSMINNIFEFDDRVAAEVMTHRTEICGVERNASLSEIMTTAIEEGYSRIPVYKEDIDTIIGVIYVKDLLSYVGRKIPADLKSEDIMREPFFVPDSISCSELFRELTGRHIQLAVLLDEYGGTAGLVTIEDLLESIVGNMRDEYDDDEEEEVVKTGEDTWEVDGGLSISELEELLGVEFPEGDYDTVGGLMFAELGHIPTVDEQAEITCEGFSFRVLELENQRIAKILITRLPPETTEEEEK